MNQVQQERLVRVDGTIRHQGLSYPVSFLPGSVVLIEPLPGQNALRILGLREPHD